MRTELDARYDENCASEVETGESEEVSIGKLLSSDVPNLDVETSELLDCFEDSDDIWELLDAVDDKWKLVS